jgi:phosphate-selective porin
MWKGPLLFALIVCCLRAQGSFEVHGYIQGRFTNQEGTPDRLEIRRARLIISGKPISKLSYLFQADLVKGPYLMDAALIYDVSRALRFTAGQFKIPFSTESVIADNLNIPIARARAVNSLVPGRDTGVQARDVGLEAAGTIGQHNGGRVEYAAGVFRGQTFVDAPAVHYHAVAARVIVHPVKQLGLGGDWYASFSAPPNGEKRRQDVEANYQSGRLRLRSEQIWGRNGTLEQRGGYALGAWRLSQRWEPLVRADWLTTNTHKPDTGSIAYITGINFYWRKYVKVGANAGAQRDDGPKGLSSVFLAQILLSY